MKFGMQIRKGTVERVKRAIELDPYISVDFTNLQSAKGQTEEYLSMLGLTHSDLLRLERTGLAVRGREPTKAGHRIKWVLLRRGDING